MADDFEVKAEISSNSEKLSKFFQKGISHTRDSFPKLELKLSVSLPPQLFSIFFEVS